MRRARDLSVVSHLAVVGEFRRMLYDKPVRALLADAIGAMPEAFSASDVIQWFAQFYPRVRSTTVRAHLVAAEFCSLRN